MKKTLLIALFCFLTLQQMTLLAASGKLPIKLIEPTNTNIVIDGYHNARNPNFMDGAKWIWKDGGQSWAAGETAIFQIQFNSECSAPISLKITADNQFSASLNGGAPVVGNDWNVVYAFTMSGVVCGSNKLRIKVVNRDQGTPAALIYLVEQDQSQCFKCAGAHSTYNRNTCQCECTIRRGFAPANSLLQWKDYPVCGFQCTRNINCVGNQYFNQKTCSCQCRPAGCPPGFTQDPQACNCVSICPEGRVWSAVENKCVCSIISQCVIPQFWNDNICDCERRYPIDPLPCAFNQIWNMELRKCMCRAILKCQSGFSWNGNTCKCERKYTTDSICPPRKIWNIQLSRCTCQSIARCAFPYTWSEQTCNCEVVKIPHQHQLGSESQEIPIISPPLPPISPPPPSISPPLPPAKYIPA